MNHTLAVPNNDYLESAIGLRGLNFLWLEITSKCNLACTHCYTESNPRQTLFGRLVLNDWQKIITDAAKMGCKEIQFIGGEPTLHPNLPAMIQHAKCEGYRLIEVYTNLTFLNQKLLDVFVQNGVELATSFYSADPDTHDSITTQEGSFKRTVEGIKRALGAGLPVRIGMIEMDANRGHIEQAITFLRNLGVRRIKTDHQRGVGRGMQVKPVSPMSELCGECWKGKLCVTAEGRVYPCVFSRTFDMGHIREGIASLIDSKHLLEFRSDLRDEMTKRSLAFSECLPNITPACDPCSPCSPCTPCSPDAGGPCSPCSPCSPDTSGPCSPCSPCSPDTSGPCSPCTPCSPDTSGPCSPCTPCSPDTGGSEPGGCYITTACVKHAGLPDNCYELQMMRAFRDQYVRFAEGGESLLADYYTKAPFIVAQINSQKNRDELYHQLLTSVRKSVSLIEASQYSEALALCRQQFDFLKQKYALPQET